MFDRVLNTPLKTYIRVFKKKCVEFGSVIKGSGKTSMSYVGNYFYIWTVENFEVWYGYQTCITFNELIIAEGVTQSAFTCSKSTIETLEQGVKYVQI